MTASARRGAGRPTVALFAMSFNQGQFIEEALDSVVAQDYPALELLVVDHGSTDPWSVETTERAAAERGLPFLALDDQGGPGPGRNAVIERMRGDYVLCLDADNMLLPGAVTRLVDQLEAEPPEVGFVYPRLTYLGGGEVAVPDYNLYALLLGNYCDTAGLWRRGCFPPEGPGFPAEPYVPHEDWQFVLELGRRGVEGRPADEPTVLLRRHGFTLSQAVEYDADRHERLVAAQPELYGRGAFAAVKRRWAPAVSVIASGDRERLGELMGAQRLGDAELVVADGATPAERLEQAGRARGAVQLFAGGRAEMLLARPELLEQLVRVFRDSDEVPALALFPAEGRYPFESLDAPSEGAPAAVAVRATVVAERLAELPVGGDEVAAVFEALVRRSRVEERGWPGTPMPTATGEETTARLGPRERPESWWRELRFRERAVPLIPPRADAAGSPDGPRPPERAVLPADALLAVRYRERSSGARRVGVAGEAPPGHEPERQLGWLARYALPGTVPLALGDAGELRPAAEGETAFGHAETRDISGLDELVLIERPDGSPAVAAGAEDPLMGDLRRRSLGWVEPVERHPREPPRSAAARNRLALRRLVGPQGHGYTLADTPSSDGARPDLELGLLLECEAPGSVPVHLLERGDAVVGLALAGDGRRPGPPAVAAAARWALAPLLWRGWRPLEERTRLTRWRLSHLPRLAGRRPARVSERPAGWLWSGPGGRRMPLLRSFHPATGDCLLTLNHFESTDFGYGEPEPIGYIEVREPRRWGDMSEPRPWCFHAGREVRA